MSAELSLQQGPRFGVGAIAFVKEGCMAQIDFGRMKGARLTRNEVGLFPNEYEK